MRLNVFENTPNDIHTWNIWTPTLLSFNSPWQASQNLRRQKLGLWETRLMLDYDSVSVKLTFLPRTPPAGSPGRHPEGRGGGKNGPSEEQKPMSDLHHRKDFRRTHRCCLKIRHILKGLTTHFALHWKLCIFGSALGAVISSESESRPSRSAVKVPRNTFKKM